MHVNHQRATCIFLLKTLVLKTLRSVEITRRKSLVTINDNKTPPSFYTYLFVTFREECSSTAVIVGRSTVFYSEGLTREMDVFALLR